jgi:hypothetical protein
MIKHFKLAQLHDKIVKNFIDYISDDKTSFIDFLLKNNFTYSVSNRLLVFYKYGVVDNSVLTYEDEDDIKISYSQAFAQEFNKHLRSFNIDIEKYYELNVEVCNHKLIKYSNINELSNGEKFPKSQLEQLIATNLVENAEIANKLDLEQIYLYKIEYKLRNNTNYLLAYKRLKQFYIALFIFVSLVLAFGIYMSVK